MQIKINDENIDFEVINEKDLIEVLEGVLEWLESNNHIASSIKVNGNLINFNDKNSYENLPINKIDIVEIISEQNDLIESINENNAPEKWFNYSIDVLDALKPELSNISVLLQTGKSKDAYDTIIIFTNILNKVLRLYSILIKNKTFNENEHIEMIKNLNNIINQINLALENDDKILIGDLFEYEINPIVEKLLKTKFN